MIRYLGLVLPLLPMIASADGASPMAAVPAKNQPPEPVVLPVPLNAPVCRTRYPGTLQYLILGTTVSFHIAADGTVMDARAFMLSGRPELDKAALACILGWHYKPATLNGAAVTMPWLTRMEWSGGHGSANGWADDDTAWNTSPKQTGREGVQHVCTNYYPAAAIRQNIEGTTLLAFHVMTDGSVGGFAVARSSGNQELDLSAVACASHWRYEPETRDGRSVEVSWQAAVQWKLPDEPPPDAPAPQN